MLRLGSLTLAALLGVLCFSASSHAEDYIYRTVTIGGGGFVTGVVFHPTEPDLIYARTDVGGAYRWNPEGSFWVALNDDIGGLNNAFMDQGVLSLAVDPQDPNRVYLAVGQYLASWAPTASILASADRGLTWTRSPLPFKLGGNQDGRSTGERLQVDPNRSQFLYLGTTADGLWRSRNYGKSWERVDSFPASSVTFVTFDKSHANGSHTRTLYVGVNAPAGSPALYRSTNGGGKWTPVPGQPTDLIPHHAEIAYGDTKTLYVTYSNSIGPNGASTGAVWKLNLGDGTWTNITPPTGQGGFAGLSVDANNPETLVVTTLDRWWPRDEVYRSTDAGATWRAVFDQARWDNSSAPWSVARSPHWLGDIDIDPTNPDRVIFITGYGLWASNDLTNADTGQTTHWEFLNEELEETVPLSIASPNSGTFHLVSALGDIGGFRHRYLRGSPTLIDYFAPYRGTTRSIAVAELDANKLVRTVGDGTRGQISTNAGGAWAYFAAAAPGALSNGPGFIDLSADGSRVLWIPNNSAAAFSTDGGASWTQSAGGPEAGTGDHRPVADKVDSNTFYIAHARTGQVFVSHDGGANFSAGVSGLPTSLGELQAVPGNEGHVWLPAWENGLYRSVDGAASFTRVSSVQHANKIGFGQAAPGADYPAMYIWGRVDNVVGFYRSTDAGDSWVRINDDQHQYGFINQMIGDPRVFGRVYLATSGRGIIYGQPEGLVTDHEEPDPNDPIFQIPPETPIYTDYRHSPWDIWWWGMQSTFTLTETNPVRSGTYSIRVPFSESWGTMYINRSAFSTVGQKTLKLWVHGGTTGGQGITVSAVLPGDQWQPAYRIPTSMVLPGQWTEIVIPLSALNAVDKDIVAFGIGAYNFSYANPPAAFYLDDIILQ